METDDIKGDFGEFDQFLKYTTGPIRAYAKSIKAECMKNIPAVTDGSNKTPARDVFDWDAFKTKLLGDIAYISGRSTAGSDVTFTPESDPMEFLYRKVQQLKTQNPRISDFEIEREVRKALPADLRMFVAPALDFKGLRHNLKIGYENYIASALGSPQSVMVVNRLVDNLESRIKKMAISGKEAGEKIICPVEEPKSDKIYPNLDDLKESAIPSAPPQYQEVMVVQNDRRPPFQNRFNNRNFQPNNRFQQNRFAPNRFQNNRFGNDRFQNNRFQPNRFNNNRQPGNFSARTNGNRNLNDRFRRNDRNGSVFQRNGSDLKDVVCWSCGVKGHYANECDTRKKNAKNARGSN